MVAAGAAVDFIQEVTGSLRLRHLGAAPLIEEGRVRLEATTLANLELYYKRGRSGSVSTSSTGSPRRMPTSAISCPALAWRVRWRRRGSPYPSGRTAPVSLVAQIIDVTQKSSARDHSLFGRRRLSRSTTKTDWVSLRAKDGAGADAEGRTPVAKKIAVTGDTGMAG